MVRNTTGGILEKEQMKALLADCTGVIVGVDPLDAEVLACAPGLKAVAKYGVGVEENSIELTLLRAAASPEMASDQGQQHFRYGFTAWEGAFDRSPVVRQGLAFNLPVTVAPGLCGRFSAFSTDAPNVILDTLKPADDGSGDMILRLYESRKEDVTFRLRSDLPVKALQPCDMLENPTGEALPLDAPLHVKPFQVLTLRVKLAE